MWPVSSLLIKPSFVFQIIIDLSKEPLAKSPFGKTTKQLTWSWFPRNFLFIDPSFVFHIIIDLSCEPLTRSPFGKIAKDLIAPVCPINSLFFDQSCESEGNIYEKETFLKPSNQF